METKQIIYLAIVWALLIIFIVLIYDLVLNYYLYDTIKESYFIKIKTFLKK